jgi:hypothetical protein
MRAYPAALPGARFDETRSLRLRETRNTVQLGMNGAKSRVIALARNANSSNSTPSMHETTARHETGFVAIEWVAAVAVLLLPVVLLVATLPVWAERKHAAAVAAREAASAAVLRAQVDPRAAHLVVREVAANYGIDARDVRVTVRPGAARGAYVTVDVHIRMPAIAVGGLLRAGAWTYTATQHRRLDDYRSR